jgi:hypothetical protein
VLSGSDARSSGGGSSMTSMVSYIVGGDGVAEGDGDTNLEKEDLTCNLRKL